MEPTRAPKVLPRFNPGNLEQLAEVYRRAKAGDNAVWAENGMVTPGGLPDAKQVERYYQAIQALSSDPARWKAFEARVANGGGGGS
jgi:hypothetical protein